MANFRLVGCLKLDILSNKTSALKVVHRADLLREKRGGNCIDFGARFYDPAIGRFTSIDPLADDFAEWTPYHYVHNNPLRYTDPTGMSADDIILRGSNNSSITIETDIVDIDLDASYFLGDLGGNYSFSGGDIIDAALDIGGLADPTGVVDAAAAVYHGNEGNYGSAVISGISVVPFGDVVKALKVGKHTKTIKNAIETISNSGAKVDPKTGRKLGGSGKARSHTVKHSTRKRAKDAARNGGKGTPVKHTKDAKGGHHYHHGSGKVGKGKGTKGYGSKSGKVSDNVHHEYPKT